MLRPSVLELPRLNFVSIAKITKDIKSYINLVVWLLYLAEFGNCSIVVSTTLWYTYITLY